MMPPPLSFVCTFLLHGSFLYMSSSCGVLRHCRKLFRLKLHASPGLSRNGASCRRSPHTVRFIDRRLCLCKTSWPEKRPLSSPSVSLPPSFSLSALPFLLSLSLSRSLPISLSLFFFPPPLSSLAFFSLRCPPSPSVLSLPLSLPLSPSLSLIMARLLVALFVVMLAGAALSSDCCRMCHPAHSKACGDACIKLDETCSQASGCACNGKRPKPSAWPFLLCSFPSFFLFAFHRCFPLL